MCPECGSHNVEQLSKVREYVGSVRSFNSAKRQKYRTGAGTASQGMRCYNENPQELRHYASRLAGQKE